MRTSSFRFDGAPEPTAQAFTFVASDAVDACDQVELRGVEERRYLQLHTRPARQLTTLSATPSNSTPTDAPYCAAARVCALGVRRWR